MATRTSAGFADMVATNPAGISATAQEQETGVSRSSGFLGKDLAEFRALDALVDGGGVHCGGSGIGPKALVITRLS